MAQPYNWRAALARHKGASFVGGFLIGRKAMRGNLWAQLLMLGSFAAYSEAKRQARIEAAKEVAGRAAVEYGKTCADPRSPECIAEAKRVAIAAGQAYMRGDSPADAITAGLRAHRESADSIRASAWPTWAVNLAWGLAVFFATILVVKALLH